jgi:gliding motility-associated-like protein
MQVFLRIFLLLMLGVGSPLISYAKHIIGGEVTYECLEQTPTGRKYRITMLIYRDCDPSTGGAYFDDPAYFSIYKGSANLNTLFTTQAITNVSVTYIIPDTPACIQNVPYVCVERGRYSFETILPIEEIDSYFIVYQRCCRNNSIVNIYDPETIGATYSVEITPKAQTFCNNSPVFNDFPPTIICKDAPLLFDHSASDVDGDQLVYSFCAPEMGGGPGLTSQNYTDCGGAQPQPPCAPPFAPVPFIQPQYSPTNPIGGNPQITIDSVTGLISGIPNKVGRFVVGVCVDEYRDGVKLSTIKRDFQFNVADCDLTVLVLVEGGDTLLLTPTGYYLSACGAKDLYIENKSLDQQFINKFEWRFDLDGVPYTNDSDWSPTIPFPKPSRYFGQLLLNPGEECADTANIVVDIFPGLNADFSYAYDTCVAGPVTFTDLSTAEANIRDWKWQFGVSNEASTDQSPVYTYQVPGEYPVSLRIIDTNGCKDSTVQFIDIKPVLQWYMPNAFTPNGDGINDGFSGKGSMLCATNFNMAIWNRWGELVFATEDPLEFWTGRSQKTGGMSPNGVYVYTVSFTGPKGEKFEYKGYATLIR